MEDQEGHADTMGRALIATVRVACGTEDGLNRFLVQFCNSSLSEVSFASLVVFHCDHSNEIGFDAIRLSSIRLNSGTSHVSTLQNRWTG